MIIPPPTPCRTKAHRRPSGRTSPPVREMEVSIKYYRKIEKMVFNNPDIEKEYNRLVDLYPDLPEYRHPLINVSDALRAYMALADYFSDPSSDVSETMLVGLRSEHLLYSALSRQVVSYELSFSKYFYEPYAR
jgi:hypothetical protein